MRRGRLSLRARVALAAAVPAAIAVFAAAAVLPWLARQDEQERLDAALRQRAEAMAAPVALDAALRGGDRRLARGPLDRRADLLVLSRLLGGGGKVLLAADDFPDGLPPAAGKAHPATLAADGKRWRVLVVSADGAAGVSADGGGGGDGAVAVQVAASLAGVDGTVGALRRLVLILGAGAVAAAGGGGWLLGAAAVRPIRRLRREAERVGGRGGPGRRVPAVGGPAEVADLAAALNAMLARIEEATARTEDALDASRQFAANAAHELRTPLTSMRTNLEVLTAHPGLPAAERARIAADVAAQQRRLQDTLDALLLLARGDLAADGAFEHADLAELLDGVVARARARHPEAAIAFEAGDGPLPARVWPEGVRVLADNLIRNALTHGRAPGAAPAVRVALAADGEGGWTLSVADRGPGIAEAERGRVVERFARGGAAGGGSGAGLGLALAAQQAALHGGRLAIAAREGGGAVVEVRVPPRAGRERGVL